MTEEDFEWLEWLHWRDPQKIYSTSPVIEPFDGRPMYRNAERYGFCVVQGESRRRSAKNLQELTMFRQMMYSKIHLATVTEANLRYIGSITIDEDLLDATGMVENERVQVVNVNTGDSLWNLCHYRRTW